MTRDEIIKALDWHAPSVESGSQSLLRRVEKLVAMAEAAEREACAKVCEMTYEGAFEGARPCFDTPQECAAAIRARREKK